MLVGEAMVNTFSSVKNMKFTMAFGYFCISYRALVILACLLADVSGA